MLQRALVVAVIFLGSSLTVIIFLAFLIYCRQRKKRRSGSLVIMDALGEMEETEQVVGNMGGSTAKSRRSVAPANTTLVRVVPSPTSKHRRTDPPIRLNRWSQNTSSPTKKSPKQSTGDDCLQLYAVAADNPGFSNDDDLVGNTGQRQPGVSRVQIQVEGPSTDAAPPSHYRHDSLVWEIEMRQSLRRKENLQNEAAVAVADNQKLIEEAELSAAAPITEQRTPPPPITSGKLTRELATVIAADQYLENSVIFARPVPVDGTPLGGRRRSAVGPRDIIAADDVGQDAVVGTYSPDLALVHNGNVRLIRKQRSAV